MVRTACPVILTSVHDEHGSEHRASSIGKQAPKHCGEQNACYKFSAALILGAPRRPLSRASKVADRASPIRKDCAKND